MTIMNMTVACYKCILIVSLVPKILITLFKEASISSVSYNVITETFLYAREKATLINDYLDQQSYCLHFRRRLERQFVIMLPKNMAWLWSLTLIFHKASYSSVFCNFWALYLLQVTYNRKMEVFEIGRRLITGKLD